MEQEAAAAGHHSSTAQGQRKENWCKMAALREKCARFSSTCMPFTQRTSYRRAKMVTIYVKLQQPPVPVSEFVSENAVRRSLPSWASCSCALRCALSAWHVVLFRAVVQPTYLEPHSLVSPGVKSGDSAYACNRYGRKEGVKDGFY